MLRLTQIFLFILFIPALFASQQTQPAPDSDYTVLLKQAESEALEGNFKKSLDYSEQAFLLSEKENDRKGMAKALVEKSQYLTRLGKYPEGISAAEQALKISEQLGDQAGMVEALTSLVNLNYRVSKYVESNAIADKAMALQKHYEDKKILARLLDYKSRNYLRLGNDKVALDYANQALKVVKENNLDALLQYVLSSIGSVYWIQGELLLALDYFDQSIEVAVKQRDSFGVGLLKGNRGLVYWNLGELEKALEDFQEAQVVFEKSSYRSGEGNNLFNIGILQMNFGEYGKAQESFQKSLEIAREIQDPGLESVVFDEFGKLHRDLGNSDLALEYFQKSYIISERIGEKRASAYALADIAGIYESRGNFKRALDRYQMALKIYEETGEKKAVAGTIKDIGKVECGLGNHQVALGNFSKALAMQEEIGYKLHEGHTHLDMAEELYHLRRFADAEKEFTASIEVSQRDGNDKVLAQALHSKAILFRELHRNNESLQLMKDSIGVIEKIRAEVSFAEQRSTYFEDKLVLYEDLIAALLQAGSTVEAFEYVQRSKARAFLDVLAEAHIQDPTLDPVMQERKKKLLKESTAANEKLQEELNSAKPDPARISSLKKKREELDAEYSKLLLDIRSLNPRFADLQRPKILTAAEAQKMLDPNSVLLEYFSAHKNSILFVITSNDIVTFNLPSESKLSNDVRAFRELLQKPDPVWEASEQAHSRYVKYAADLYNNLIRPASSFLQNKERIVVAPDGPLHYLPFESLLTGRQAKSAQINFAKLPYLGAEYEIHYVPSVSVLGSVQRSLVEDTAGRNQLIAFADPSTKPTTKLVAANATVRDWAGSLAPLPHSRAEVKEISNLYPPDTTQIFIGQDATEKTLKTMKLDRYKYIHFASHGLIDEQNPQFSSILFAADRDGSEDGFLTMREVFDLRLKADLVVLSACKTGLGKQIRGEGVTGLSRAFLSAGSPSVLVSLWNVYDRSTADFMIAFYKQMQTDGTSHTAALKEARINLIRSGKFSHPYYWAPFVLIGDR